MKKTKVTLDRFEGDFAVVLVGSENLNIPKKMMPEDSKEGDVVYITISSDNTETENQEELARSILNEVLKEE